jgi:hypothetical protein
MKHRKHLLKTCVLAVLFVCAVFAPSVYAGDGPPESQSLGIGLATVHSGGGFFGFNVRSWTEDKLGWEVGWATRGHSYSSSIYDYGYSWRYHVIPGSVLYTLKHADYDSLYIRPYIGGGLNIVRYSSGYDSRWNIAGEHASATRIGGQGFAGAEFTFKAIPKLGIGGDLGFGRAP